MKITRFLSVIIALGVLVFVPPALYGQEETGGAAAQGTPGSPAIAPALVPEGVLAMELAKALNLGEASNEAEAENLLSAAGIEPKNGWIGDYPVTPDVLGEINQAVASAADAGKLSLDRDAATEAVDETAARLGLAFAEAGGPAPPYTTDGPYAESQPPAGYSGEPYGEYPAPVPPSPEAVNNYYYNYGPPVVTYYPPPEAYGYLYAWVPYPFWYSSIYFSGFFILHDFHRTVTFHHRPFIISNHFVHPRTRTVSRVDPVTRSRFGRGTFPPVSPSHHFQTPSAQAGASSIVAGSRRGAQHGTPQANPGNGTSWRAPSSGGGGAQQQTRPAQRGNPRFSGGSNWGRTKTPNPSSGPTVTTIKPIQPSAGGRQSAGAQTAPSARQGFSSGRAWSSGNSANVPQASAGRESWAGRASIRQPGSDTGGFTARRGGGFPGSAAGSRFSRSAGASRASSSSSSGGSRGFFGVQSGASSGIGAHGFSRMR